VPSDVIFRSLSFFGGGLGAEGSADVEALIWLASIFTLSLTFEEPDDATKGLTIE
jgi:hypothetical protein